MRRCKTTCVVNEKTNIVNKKNKNLTKKKNYRPRRLISIGGEICGFLGRISVPAADVLAALRPFNAVALVRINGTEAKYFSAEK